MLRSGFILSASGPAAILALLVLPSVRQGADAMVVQKAPAISAPASTARPVPKALSLDLGAIQGRPRRLATLPRSEAPAAPAPAVIGPTASEKELPKPRRITREGCEAPLSSLVGPEARRMVPGRCMT